MSIHKNAFPCIVCPEHFASKSEQADHLATAHTFTQPWLCHQCSESFKDMDGLDTHKATAHRQSGGVANKYQCSLPACGHHFASEKMHLRHRQQDHTQQAARMGKGLKRGCTQRGCHYTNESCVAFSVHMLHLHQPKCEACGAKFEEFAELQKHRNERGRDGACALTNAEPSGSSTVASSSSTTANIRSENRHASPAPSRTGSAAFWLPTDGRYGSLLDDSPAFVSYDPVQHGLLNWALGDWAQPTEMASAPTAPECAPRLPGVASPIPLPVLVPSPHPALQQRQSQYQGEHGSPPQELIFQRSKSLSSQNPHCLNLFLIEATPTPTSTQVECAESA